MQVVFSAVGWVRLVQGAQNTGCAPSNSAVALEAKFTYFGFPWLGFCFGCLLAGVRILPGIQVRTASRETCMGLRVTLPLHFCWHGCQRSM